LFLLITDAAPTTTAGSLGLHQRHVAGLSPTLWPDQPGTLVGSAGGSAGGSRPDGIDEGDEETPNDVVRMVGP